MIYFVLIVSVVVFLLYKQYKRPKDYPPGPLKHPIVGNILSMNYQSPSTTFYKWMKKYGDIYSVKFGGQEVVVLNDPHMIKEALCSNDFTDRPNTFSFGFTRSFRNVGIIVSSGNVWKENRRFSMRHLRDYGLGKQSIEDTIKNEIVEQMQKIQSKQGELLELDWDFNVAISNIIWAITAGKRFETDSDLIITLHRLVQEAAVVLGESLPLDAFPWLLYLPKHIFKVDKIENVVIRLTNFFKAEVEEHKRDYNVNEDPFNLIDSYLKKFSEECQNPDFDIKAEEFNLIWILTDLFVAGGETIYTTLRWAFLYLIKYPDIQEKIQDELDEVVGKDRLPSLRDQDKLVFTSAFIMETQRHANVVVNGVIHNTTRDTVFRGYRIPKNTQLIPNLHACHMNPKYWGDSHKFCPERFIDGHGHLKKSDALMPFSIGRRICFGESLAKTELFLFITCILQKFNFEYDGDHNEVCLAPENEGFIRFPKHYKMRATLR